MSNFITFRPTQIACINNKLNDKLELQKKKTYNYSHGKINVRKYCVNN